MTRFLILLLCCWCLGARAAPREVQLVTQYDYPPFITGDKQGLTFELADALTRLSHGHFRFRVEVLPRKRLSQLVEHADWRGMVPWVAPPWFRDVERERFSWSGVVMHDADWVVSSSMHPLEWQGAASLSGQRLGGLLGHVYVDVEADIARGRIVREDVATMDINLRKLQRGRVDATFISASTYGWYRRQQPQLLTGLYVAKLPRSVYERHFMSARSDGELGRFLDQAVNMLAHDASWQYVLRRYGLADLRTLPYQ
ncbi:substrate-binding periplasmic protein [Chitinibacteraceae bacterium HSL-7]